MTLMEKQDITFKIYKDYMDTGNLYSKTEVTFHEGLTVLVGCNGSGKTTMLKQIEDNCKKKDIRIRCLKFDNLSDGGHNSSSSLAFFQDFEGLAYNLMSSEGEQISTDFGRFSSKIAKFFIGKLEPDSPFERIFGESAEYQKDKLVVLLDAIDSGLSIDNMIEVKELIKDTIFKDAEKYNIHLWVIAVSNAYELARNEDCFDLWSCSYIRFKDYEDYRKYVLKTRKRKDQRIKRYNAKLEKQQAKEKEELEQERNKWSRPSLSFDRKIEIEEDKKEDFSEEELKEMNREATMRANEILKSGNYSKSNMDDIPLKDILAFNMKQYDDDY